MKKQETYAVLFVLRNSKVAQNEKSSLSVRVTANAQRVEMSLGLYLTESLWDEKMQKCKGMTREAKGTNGFIDATLFRLSDIRQRLIIEGKGVTADFIKARYKGLPDTFLIGLMSLTTSKATCLFSLRQDIDLTGNRP